MDCPRCQSPLEDPNARFCPLCGASIVPGEQPPHTPEPVISGPPPSFEPPPPRPGPEEKPEAHCAAHADRVAIDICSRCGSFACRECLVLGADGQGVCSACLARQGGDTAPVPWERRGELGLWRAYWETTKAIMFNPNTAFDRVEPETGRWWDPLSYGILSNFLALSGTLVAYAFIGAIGLIAAFADKSSSKLGGAEAVGIAIGVVIAFCVAIPLGAMMAAFVIAGVEHLALRLVGVQTRDFEATLRTYCYSQAPMFWGVVPFCGAYAYPIWQIVCRIYGYKSMHRTTGGKAAAGVLLPTGLCCGAIAIFYGAIIAASIAGR